MAKTFDTIISEMATEVNAQLGSQDTRTGTVLREGFLAPVASQLEEAYARTDQVEANQSIIAPTAISDLAMEKLAANFGLARFPGSPSSGSIRLFRFNVPPSPISILSGTVVTTSDSGDNLQFKTLASVVLSNVSPQDPVTGAYYVDVACVAVISGTVGNVDADTITFHSIPGIDEITNPNAFSGGKDVQSNTELADLIIARAQGNMGTRGGYESLVRDNFAVDDMNIITPTDPEAQRDQYGGELDITILSSNQVQSTETTASNTVVFNPTFLPLIEVVDIVGIENITDLQKTLVPVTDYDVVIDDYSPLSRSYIEKSRVNIHVTSFAVKPNTVFTIRYKNSELIRVIQSFIVDVENAILGADVLVKLALEIPVNIEADIRIIPGFDPTTTQAAVVSAIQSFLAGKLLDDDIQVSDVVTVIGGVSGVDSVDLTTFRMAKASAPFVYLQEILANKQEYLRIAVGQPVVTVVG